MGKGSRTAKGCGIAAAIAVAIPLLILGTVGVKTWLPLQRAGESLAEIDRTLGPEAIFVPAPAGAIPPDRMALFLELRGVLVTACEDYATVRKGFESVETLESQDPEEIDDVGGVFVDLGGASLSITPFLARFFELRNDALLAASMGLQEYAYIYAVTYHDRLLSEQTRNEIFSNGEALSPEASEMLWGCLARQLAGVPQDTMARDHEMLTGEIEKMESDPSRLLWQQGLPDAVRASVAPYRDRLDGLFCGATAGLEMERGARRALWIAIE